MTDLVTMQGGPQWRPDPQDFFDRLSMGIIRSRVGGGIEYMNSTGASILGYASPEELMSSVSDLSSIYVDPADRDRLVASLLEEGSVTGHRARIRRADGEARWLEMSGRVVRDVSGRVEALEGAFTDITERHRSLAILEAVRGSAHVLLEDDWLERAEAILRDLGEAAEVDRVVLSGRREEFAVLATWERDVVDGPRHARALEVDDRSLAALQSGQIVIARPDRDEICAACPLTPGFRACSVVPIRDGKLWATLVFQVRSPRTWTDGTLAAFRAAADLFQAAFVRDRLKQTHERLIEQVPVVVYEAPFVSADQATPWIYVSPRIQELTGYTAEEWLADPRLWLDSLHPDEAKGVLDEEERCCRLRIPLHMEYRMRRRDGSWIWVRDDAELVGAGSVILRGVLLDVTAEHAAREETAQAFAMLKRSDDDRRRLLKQLADAQEAERSRIANDVHDDPIQAMTAAGLRLHMLRRVNSDNEEALQIVDQVSTSISSAIQRLRRMMFELRPRSLDEEGLATALRESMANLQSTGPVQYSLDSFMEEEPPMTTRVVAFRVVQEALANVRRHSRATRCHVTVRTRARGVHVEVRDDGVGFDPGEDARSPSGHLGLSAMRERAEGAGGWFRVLSSPGEGTTVEFMVPLDAEDLGVPQAEAKEREMAP